MTDNNLPINMENQETSGTISYANEVIAIIAGMAMSEVDGVAGRSSAKTVTQYLGISKGSKAVNPATKGVRVEVGSEEASVDLTLSVEYGKPIQKVCTQVQENVRKAIESMTGLHVVKVDVHVTGVIFEKDEQSREAQNQSLAAEKIIEKPAAKKPEDEEKLRSTKEEDLEIDVEIETDEDVEATAEPDQNEEE